MAPPASRQIGQLTVDLDQRHAESRVMAEGNHYSASDRPIFELIEAKASAQFPHPPSRFRKFSEYSESGRAGADQSFKVWGMTAKELFNTNDGPETQLLKFD